MFKIPLFLPVPDFAAVLALTPILVYRKIKYGFTFMRIKLTRGKFAIVDARDFIYLRNYRWYAKRASGTFYAMRTFFENGKKKQISMHRQIMNPPKDKFIDHKNHNGLDNRRSNLRQATMAENNRNHRKVVGRGSSVYKGVSFNKPDNNWYAEITFNGQKIFLGYFDGEIEAAKAYDEAAKKYYGRFASLNFDSAPASQLPKSLFGL